VTVLHSKDLASHADLESCAAYREVRSEALTEARIGQPSSRESWFFPGADAVHGAEGKTDGRAIASACRPGAVLDPGMCARSLYGNREISGLTSCGTGLARIGKARSRSR
jgi:hypothetical protein